MAAVAMNDHIILYHSPAPPIQSHTRGRFREQIVPKRRSDAHPHQPAAFAHLARLRAAGAPSEALRSGLEAADQIALRKGPSRVFEIGRASCRERVCQYV